jgi:hypothetical protein
VREYIFKKGKRSKGRKHWDKHFSTW